jgi:hypothetical protein
VLFWPPRNVSLEACQGGVDQPNGLVVIDREALAAERERVVGVRPVEFVDKACSLVMQRLAAIGLSTGFNFSTQ